jgi:hypothetical protein
VGSPLQEEGLNWMVIVFTYKSLQTGFEGDADSQLENATPPVPISCLATICLSLYELFTCCEEPSRGDILVRGTMQVLLPYMRLSREEVLRVESSR